MSDNEFNMYIISEQVARGIYKSFKVSNIRNDGVDSTFEFIGISLYYSKLKMPMYHKIYDLLKEEYDIDMLELNFTDKQEKQKVINYIKANKVIDNSIRI